MAQNGNRLSSERRAVKLADYSVRLLGPGDLELLLAAHSEVFDHPVQRPWASEFLADARHHIVAGLVGGQMIASATAVRTLHPDQPPSLFIIEVAVARAHQRRGIAKAMLQLLLAHAHSLGCATAWVGTEQSNTPARHLYTAVGGWPDSQEFITFSFEPSARRPAQAEEPS